MGMQFLLQEIKDAMEAGNQRRIRCFMDVPIFKLSFVYVDAIRVIRHIFNMLTSYTIIFRNMYFLCIYFIYTLMIYIN
ncbi:hypothetical protein HanRHA438_Chr00c35g0855921 [Helianthus annuus]|uniref:Uncharacterized protein n=1 Tax=Helianthus annuus TaxID=4232 RepID=A0A251S8B9_HELAN|nr:hypothetical protein HanXRQr2_Chr15g0692491 [Helianthus annuus]KAJ0451144.1 hypothetical protein HanHA300_Chr15g0564211 [Helianthus annuus]KAJ0455561.1 hypothetical protein HanIR_Chr15g0752551 [Helianthus annuus]KAJ0473015.1 hypothetical protein HanHA89_Chr15g0613511 [Helianthus annuus]KAJ0648618.1 hypothetical protein HanLR1_Chr15g0574891 [Helianthus annuus]